MRLTRLDRPTYFFSGNYPYAMCDGVRCDAVCLRVVDRPCCEHAMFVQGRMAGQYRFQA